MVTGGLLWWRHQLLFGCYAIGADRDELRLFPRDAARLDNAHCQVTALPSQVATPPPPPKKKNTRKTKSNPVKFRFVLTNQTNSGSCLLKIKYFEKYVRNNQVKPSKSSNNSLITWRSRTLEK